MLRARLIDLLAIRAFFVDGFMLFY